MTFRTGMTATVLVQIRRRFRGKPPPSRPPYHSFPATEMPRKPMTMLLIQAGIQSNR